MTTPTDWRALCAELLDGIELDVAHVQDPDRFQALLARARTALAQPEPVGVTDEAIDQIYWDESWRAGADDQSEINEVGLAEFRLIARAALARWGRPAITPIPVSERLPEPHDLSPGKPQCCWCWDEPEWSWRLAARGYLSPGDLWLPYSAIADVSDRQPAPDATAP